MNKLLLQEIVFESLYYVMIYVTLFVSIFWLIIFFEKKDQMNKDPERPKRIPSITMVIPAYNEEDVIVRTMDSILSQNYPKGKLRLIVVDDASTDGTVRVVKDYQKNHRNVKLLIHSENQRKAAALNTALKHVDTDLIGFLDGDSELDENSLINSIGYIKGKTVGVIGNILPKDSVTITQKLQRVEYAFTALLRKLLTYLGSLYMTPAFALYDTKTIRKLGGWDHQNFTEDLEMGMRLQKNGYNVESCMNATVRTNTPQTMKLFWRQRIRWYRGFIFNSKKHKSIYYGRTFNHLGWFVLPIQFIILSLSIPVFAYGFYLIVRETFFAVTNFYNIGFDLQYFLIKSMEINMNFFNVILFVFTACGLAVLISYGSKKSGQRLSKLEYLLYIPIYPIINALLWMSVLTHEITRREYKW